MTADGIDHGDYVLEECLWALIERYEDGYINCPILHSGGKCEECQEAMERWWKKEEEQ